MYMQKIPWAEKKCQNQFKKLYCFFLFLNNSLISDFNKKCFKQKLINNYKILKNRFVFLKIDVHQEGPRLFLSNFYQKRWTIYI